MQKIKIKNQQTLNSAIGEFHKNNPGANEYDLYMDDKGTIIIRDHDFEVIPDGYTKRSLDWIQGYLWDKNVKPSFFQQYHRGKISNLGNFQTQLMKTFIVADILNRKSLMVAFSEYFNPGDETLEWD